VKKAVVLLSGGLDSATTLFFAKKKKFKPNCLIFDYGQRHKKEINSAKRIAKVAGCEYKLIKFSLRWKGSALLDKSICVPKRLDVQGILESKKIPSTYVPARNIIFLSFAVSYAETIKADSIFIGVNSIDYSGYPDCRPEFFQAYIKSIKLGTKSGVAKRLPKIEAPLINKTKSQIINLGLKLGVPYKLTWSCYLAGKLPCGKCDSCLLRQKGFREAGIEDPLNG